uniref:AlNc14C457G11773 protein n=1 Tax=Albugo laibachii Nc14 TaxID=890382 RepID=F0X034_9STRA|nr:AlNc14C457G11773 [Albugo laibachii Nc14]|eukprot:CCA27116.1 AlNc14C457G11773 [Albugo laibachii Nc14]
MTLFVTVKIRKNSLIVLYGNLYTVRDMTGGPSHNEYVKRSLGNCLSFQELYISSAFGVKARIVSGVWEIRT